MQWWCNTFAWTYDPRNPAKDLPAYIPFDLYPAQAELIDWALDLMRQQKNGATPKSRGTGATWTFCALSNHHFLFRDGISITWGSRKEELVDEIGDPDSIFEKLRILLRRLPDWMLPRGFNFDDHSHHKKLVNPDNGSTITGEQGRNMGRGGRSSLYIRDEAAHGNHLDEIERAVLENTECLIDISTPNGIGNPFEKKVTKGSVEVFEMPWDTVPWRGESWLEKKKSDYAHDPLGFQQEIMMSFSGSTDQAVIRPDWVRAAINIDLGEGEGSGHEAGLSLGMDVGEKHDRNVLCGRRGPSVEMVEDWTDMDTVQSARKVITRTQELEGETLCFDSIGIGATVSGTLANWEGEAIEFEHRGVNVGDRPTDRVWPNDKTSVEQFANLKAELMWTLRERFRKTYERAHGITDHPADECISIPAHSELRTQCSWPQWFRNSKGKIQIESKKQTKKRLGTTESYDFLDALMLSFADDVVDVGEELLMGWA